MLLFTNYANPDTAVIKLLKNLSINIDPAAVSTELEKHPDYPSLLAISDVLTNFNIENAAFKVEHDQVADVPCPFIAHTNLNNKIYQLILIINDLDFLDHYKRNHPPK